MFIITRYFPYSLGSLILLPLLVLFLSLAGCAADGFPSGRQSAAVPAQKTYATIAVIPFQKITADRPPAAYVRCPLSGSIMRTCGMSGVPEQKVEEAFTRKLRTIESALFIPSDRVQGMYRRLAADSFKASPLEVACAIGKELNVESIVVGYLFCYRERKGYTYSVETPASVAFNVHLIDVNRGAIQWTGTFDKTQTSLMENVLDISSFIRGGGQWVTADELIEEGVEVMLKTFPGVR